MEMVLLFFLLTGTFSFRSILIANIPQPPCLGKKEYGIFHSLGRNVCMIQIGKGPYFCTCKYTHGTQYPLKIIIFPPLFLDGGELLLTTYCFQVNNMCLTSNHPRTHGSKK